MDIPRYPAVREIEVDDKELLDPLFHRLQPRVSELSFAGLYLFRKAHAYRLTVCEDSVVVLGKGYAGGAYFLPPISGDRVSVARRLLREGGELYGADDDFVSALALPEEFEAREDRDNFDYLHLRQELAELPGNRFHRQKNRISYFTRRHECRIEPFSPDFLEQSLDLLNEWHRIHGVKVHSLQSETEAAREGLRLADRLALRGLVAVVEGRVKAFVLGERLSNDTSVCHFEKADPFLEGLYQLIDREFSRLLFNDCRYVNREQDLGEANLRQAKMSYRPVELIRKYRVKEVKSKSQIPNSR